MGWQFVGWLDGLTQLAWLLAFWVAIIGLVSMGLAALIAGGLTVIVNPAISNCLAYALRRWWDEGGYVVLLWSRWTKLPHFVWSANMVTFWQFVPDAPHRHRWYPPLVFYGHEDQWHP